MNRRLVRATALFVIVSWAWMSPPQALAQLVGSLIVNITSPLNGSTVSGTVTVTASVTIIGALTVRDVQFKLDGVNLGSADTSAPYSVPWNTTTASNGSHTLTAVARDLLGLQFTSNPVTVTVSNADTTPPTVSLTAPANEATVSSTITVSANASDNVGVVGVQFKLDGANLGTEDTAAPYSRSWDTTTASNGSHTLTAVARDAAGNTGTAATITVTVSNDTSPPTVAITAPANGATVSGSTPVNASASDNVGVVGVQFFVDGNPLGTEDTAAPYTRTWDTTTASNGSHTLTAVARDAAGNQATSAAVTVTVSNDTTQPTVTINQAAGQADPASTAPINFTAVFSEPVSGFTGTDVTISGTAGGTKTSTVTGGPSTYNVAVSGMASSGTVIATIGAGVASDSSGNTNNASTSTDNTVTFNLPDTTPPTVSLTAPANGVTVSGSTPVNASASDNVGVVGVQFQLDGVNLGVEDTAAPYAVSWDTTTASDGSHTLTAVARDAAGNSGTATTITVTVSNGAPPDTTPPTVSLTAPANGATVSGTTNVTATASDNVGVVGVQFQLDGVNLGAEDPSAPYAVSWDTTTTSNGSHTLTAVARDAAVNSTTSAGITVTVSNGPPPTGGDIFLAFADDGRVQWHNPDGSLRQILTGTSTGQASSVAFDAARNIYVPHWVNQTPGNFVERFDPNGNLLGIFGSGYDLNPSSLTFDAAGNVYVGQADGTGDILKFNAAGTLVASYDVLTTVRGTDHIDLASDGCTMFYSSRDKNIYRYNVCTNTQLPKFNAQDLPGDAAYHLRVLPDGGVLVADGLSVIVRLDASGNQTQTYAVPGEVNLWGGVDLVGDGTFWASNAWTDTAYRFDLQSGTILASINVCTPGKNPPCFTLAGVGVRR